MSEIMVVDDKSFVSRNLKKALEIAGYTVDTEQNPRVAVGRIVNGPYGLVFSDTEMPEITGLKMMDIVRGRECEVPFVGTSSDGGYENDWKSRGADFIKKSYSTRPYIEAAREILGH